MNILYIVGNGSRWRNNELRYSLRSLEKNGINVGRIFIVGECPDWVNKDLVTHIPASDIYICKHHNILYKVLYAIEKCPDLGEHFLISSDDHFYIKPTDFDKLPVYYREKAIPATVKPEHRNNPYFKSLLETRDMLQRHKLTIYQTNPHCNTHIDVPTIRKHKALFDECFKLQYGGELNCVMGNLLIKQGWKKKLFHDCKIGMKIETPEAFKARVGNTECISGTDNIEISFLGRWLEQNFPYPCKYEKEFLS